MNRPSIVNQILLFTFLAGCVWLGVFQPPFDLAPKLYHVLGLFSHDSAWVFEPRTASDSTVIRWLAVLAPVASALAIVTLLLDWVRPLRLRWAAWTRVYLGAKCVALIGLTEESLALAASIHADRTQGTVPIILADDPDPGLARSCQRDHIAIFRQHGQPVSAWAGRFGRGRPRALPVNKMLNRAWGVISFLPTAGGQLDFIAELQSSTPSITEAASRFWVLLDDRGLAQRLEDHVERLVEDDFKASRGGKIVPRLLTLNMLRARHLLASRQFDTLADAFGQPQIHLAIYGFGATGRAIAKEAAQLYVTRPSLTGIKLRVTFFDKDPVSARAALFAEDPGLANVISVSGHEAHFASAGLLEEQVQLLPADVTGHLIAFGNAASAFSLAVSLRRWLLEPPALITTVQPSRAAAPIFVRTPSWRGLGQLFCKRVDAARTSGGRQRTAWPIPDGIFGYGAIEDLFGAVDRGLAPAAALLDPDSECGAQELHATYHKSRAGVAGSTTLGQRRVAETAWTKLPSSLRESNFRAYDHIPIKARAIGWRFRPSHSDPPHNSAFREDEAKELAKLEHRRYMAERIANGWRYAAQRLDAVRVHPDLVDWDSLNEAEQQLDAIQIAALPAVATAARHRLARALLIGIVGHRPDKVAKDEVKPRLLAKLGELKKHYGGRELLVMTALAPGTDSWAAEAAMETDIPFMAAFPLPYELYREDFAGPGELSNFHYLAAKAELHIELPLRFGRASELTQNRQPAPRRNLERRNKQYALAGAYIVERAHELIAVYDGGQSGGTGGTAETVSWWLGDVPEEYATPAHFFVRPEAKGRPLHVIKPNSGGAPGRSDASHH